MLWYNQGMMNTAKQLLARNDQSFRSTMNGTGRLPCVGLIMAQLRSQFRSQGRSSRARLTASQNPKAKRATANSFALSVALLLAVFTHLHSIFAATHTWTGASGDGKWSTAANWSGGAPTAGEAASVTLTFPAAGAKSSVNDIANLTVDTIQISGDNYVISATGAGTNVTLRSQTISSTFFITGANAIVTNFVFTISTNAVNSASAAVATGDTATFRCRFTGPGGFVKRANGTLVLRGNAANTYSGFTEIQGGKLQLNQTGNAIPGDLVIGYPAIANLAEVELLFQNQVADGAHILVNNNGTFTPSVFTETIASITLSNANLVAGTGLTLNGSFTSIGTNTVTGTIRLGGANRIFDVTGYLTLDAFLANLSGTAGPIKEGSGVMELKRANSFNGTTTVNAGTLLLSHASALGTTSAGTEVNAAGTLELVSGLSVTNEMVTLRGHGADQNGSLVLHNNSTWNGDVSIDPPIDDASINVPGAGDVAVINGAVTGAYLGKIGPGTLCLAGSAANTLAGIWAHEGTVQLAKTGAAFTYELEVGQMIDAPDAAKVVLMAPNQIPDNAFVSIRPSGWLALNGFSDDIGLLYLWRGRISTGAGTLGLRQNVFVSAAPDGYGETRSFISGNLTLNAAERVFTLGSGQKYAELEITGNIADGNTASGITVAGVGTLRLIGGPNSYSGTTRVSNKTVLDLSYGAQPGSTAGGTVVENGGSLIIADLSVGTESLTLSGSETNVNSALIFTGTCGWNGPVAVNGECIIYGYENDLLTQTGAISGPGSLIKRGAGTLRLGGSSDNTLTGGIRVDHGQLELQKSSGAVAIPGPLTIGQASKQGSVVVRLLAHNQIANNVVPFIESNGALDLNDFDDAVGGLYLRGGEVYTGLGTLTLLGNVDTDNSPINGYFVPAAIYGHLSLGGATRTFNVGSNGAPHTLSIGAQISDGGAPAGITVTGAANYGGSWTILQSSNSFTGPVLVSKGTLHVWDSGSLGSPVAGTTVSDGAAIALGLNLHVTGEPLALSGSGPLGEGALQSVQKTTNRWSGPITLNGSPALVVVSEPNVAGFSPDAALVLDGPITGSGELDISALGRVSFEGNQANSYSGQTRILRGDVRLAKNTGVSVPGNLAIESASVSRVTLEKDEQIANSASVEINGTGELRLSGFTETIAGLSGTGTLDAGSGKLILNSPGTDLIFDGTMLGSGSTNLVHAGSGTLELTGHSTFSGKTLIQGGSLFVNGSISNSAVYVHNGAKLGGVGTVGSLNSSGGIIAPGANGAAPQYGRLRSVGSINLGSGSEFQVDLGGTNAGVDCDQLEMLGGVLVIPGCSLTVAQHSGGAISNQHTILNVVSGGASMGTFTGLNDGANVMSSTGRAFRVDYFAGADNNDIVLTQLDALLAATFTGIQKIGLNMQLSGQGTPSGTYEVQANSNLTTTNWVNIGSVVADWNGVISFTDTNAPNFSQRFYRFKLQ